MNLEKRRYNGHFRPQDLVLKYIHTNTNLSPGTFHFDIKCQYRVNDTFEIARLHKILHLINKQMC